jgi:hypothetical protein
MLGRNIQLIRESFARNSYYFANVPDDLPPPASGTKACFAGDVQKVLKAWELSASFCWYFYVLLRDLEKKYPIPIPVAPAMQMTAGHMSRAKPMATGPNQPVLA